MHKEAMLKLISFTILVILSAIIVLAQIEVDGEGGECGNHILETGEQCEGTNLNGQTCISLGYAGGTLICYPYYSPNGCTFDTTGCTQPVCGNSIVEPGEQCDPPGQIQTQSCPLGGTKTRSCTASCIWGSWSTCPPLCDYHATYLCGEIPNWLYCTDRSTSDGGVINCNEVTITEGQSGTYTRRTEYSDEESCVRDSNYKGCNNPTGGCACPGLDCSGGCIAENNHPEGTQTIYCLSSSQTCRKAGSDSVNWGTCDASGNPTAYTPCYKLSCQASGDTTTCTSYGRIKDDIPVDSVVWTATGSSGATDWSRTGRPAGCNLEDTPSGSGNPSNVQMYTNDNSCPANILTIHKATPSIGQTFSYSINGHAASFVVEEACHDFPNGYGQCPETSTIGCVASSTICTPDTSCTDLFNDICELPTDKCVQCNTNYNYNPTTDTCERICLLPGESCSVNSDCCSNNCPSTASTHICCDSSFNCVVEDSCRASIPKACSAADAQDNSISELGNAIDDVYCTYNLHDGCSYVLSSIETVQGQNNASFWEPESCGGDGGASNLYGEKKVYIDNINKYKIKARVNVDDTSIVWIRGTEVDGLNRSCCGWTNWIDVESYFITGWNTIKFRARDLCSEGRYFNLDWNITLKEGYGPCTSNDDCTAGTYCSKGIDGDLPSSEWHCCANGKFWDGVCKETGGICYPSPPGDCPYTLSQPEYWDTAGCFQDTEPGLPYERACCYTDMFGDWDYYYCPISCLS